MEIRNHKAADIPDIARLFFNTIRRINARDYTPAQIRAWAPTIYNNDYWAQRFARRQVLVAEYKNKVVGFAEYELNGHIDCFYAHHEHQGAGVGTALLTRIEQELGNMNVRRLYAEVSLTARAFFEKRGFRITAESNTQYQDVSLKLFLMEKYF
jgi:putative acetyltransferase